MKLRLRRKTEARRSFDKVRIKFTEVNTDCLREEERARPKRATLYYEHHLQTSSTYCIFIVKLNRFFFNYIKLTANLLY